MNNRAKLYQVPNARRIKEAVVRIEAQPYNFPPARSRAPRIGGSSSHFWCQLSGTLAAATGTWPSITPGTLTAQTIYSAATGSLVAIAGTHTIYNWWPTSFSASKTTLLLPNGNGTYDLAEQAC